MSLEQKKIFRLSRAVAAATVAAATVAAAACVRREQNFVLRLQPRP